MLQNKKVFKVILSGLFVCLFTSMIYAEADFNLTSFRQRGMGGAGVAVSNDLDSLIINPAGLMNVQGFKLRILEARAELNQKLVDNASKLSSLSGNDPEKFINTIKDIMPTQLGGMLSVGPLLSMGWQGFGLGFFGQEQLSMDIVRKTDPTFKINELVDGAGIIGFANNFNWFGVPFKAGINGKYVIRGSSYDDKTGSTILEYGISDMLDMMNGDWPTMNYYAVTGPAFDIGTLTTFNSFLGTTNVAIVVQNIGANLTGKKYIDNVASNYSVQIPVKATLGFGWDKVSCDWPVINFFVSDLTLAADFDIVSQDTSFFKKTHFGAERLLFGDMVKVRAGLNQGYVVGGIGMDLFIFHLNYAYYVESLGSEVGIGEQKYHIIQGGIYF